MEEMQRYWDAIPVGRSNRKTYEQLSEEWGVGRRYVRLILHRLSERDNGDDLVLVRSAHSNGFYRTRDRDEIERYGREVTARATSQFAPLKKVRRVLGQDDRQMKIDL